MQLESAGMCYCSYSIIDCDGKEAKRDYIVPEKTDFKALLKENCMGCSTVVFSREALGDNRFLTDYYHEDYVLWLELLHNGVKTVGCTETLAGWRLVQNSRSFDKRRSAAHRWDIYRNHLHFSRAYSLRLFVAYVFNGVKKYLK